MPKGALTRDELLAVWRGSVDPEYARGLEAGGDGAGIEVYAQGAEQLARVSRAVDTTTQAGYILPWSGQTGEPASGARKATVELIFTRSKRLNLPLVLAAGVVRIEEQNIDYGPDGGVPFLTGRRYVLLEDVVFQPGERGPISVEVEAERPGYGYNNPLPGSITSIVQSAVDFMHGLASVEIVPVPAASPAAPYARFRVAAANEPDMFIPDHLGQYIELVAGDNAGAVLRVSGYQHPDPDAGIGSIVDVVRAVVLRSNTTSGAPLTPGETVLLDDGGGHLAYFRFLRTSDDGSGGTVATAEYLNGVYPPIAGSTMTGVSSGAVLPNISISIPAEPAGAILVAEQPDIGIGGASWRAMSWDDFGLTASNALSPDGGRSPMLDQLGADRNIARNPGDSDDIYRLRVAQIADTVSPNAIRRALNRALGTIHWCFREVGSRLLPGMYFDGDATVPRLSPHGGINDAYDTDCWLLAGNTATGEFLQGDPVVVEHATDNVGLGSGLFGRFSEGGAKMIVVRKSGLLPVDVSSGYRVRDLRTGATWTVNDLIPTLPAAAREFRRFFDYEQFRAFFLVGVAPVGGNDFGFAYDADPDGAYDLGGDRATFYDGSVLSAGANYLRAKYEIDAVKAGGVGYDLYQASDPSQCSAETLPGDPVEPVDPGSLSGVYAFGRAVDAILGPTGALLRLRSIAGTRELLGGAPPPVIVRGARRLVLDALRFTAASDEQLVPSTSDTFGTITLFASFRTTSSQTETPSSADNSAETIFSLRAAGTAFATLGFSAGQLRLRYYDGSSWNTVLAAAGLNDGAMHDVALVHGGGNLAAYVDGVLVIDVTLAPAAQQPAPIGVGSGELDGYGGELYEAGVFAAALSSDDVLALHGRTVVLYA